MFEVCLLELVWVSSCAPILWFSQYRGGSHSHNASVHESKMNRKTAWLIQATNSCLEDRKVPWVHFGSPNQRHGCDFGDFLIEKKGLKIPPKSQPSPCISTQLPKNPKEQNRLHQRSSARTPNPCLGRLLRWGRGRRWKFWARDQGMMPFSPKTRCQRNRQGRQALENSWFFLGWSS